MKMKKAIAGLVASVVAISAMATTLVSAAETTKTFEAYEVETKVTVTSTVKGTYAAADGDLVVDFSGVTEIDTKAVKVTSIVSDGKEVKDIDSVVSLDKATGIITIEAFAFDVDEKYTVTLEAKTKNYDTLALAKTDAEAFAAADVDASFGSLKSSAKATQGKVYAKFTKDAIVGLGYGIPVATANLIGANKGATLTFKFVLPEAKTDDEIKAPGYDDGISFGDLAANDFGIRLNGSAKLSTAGVVDKTAGTITFKWDDLLAAANIPNATGLVNSIQYQAKGDLVDKEFKLESVTVTLGAAVTDPTPETSTPETSTPGTETNPKTGNAPIALAIIPVALAAAAIVASKKRA